MWCLCIRLLNVLLPDLLNVFPWSHIYHRLMGIVLTHSLFTWTGLSGVLLFRSGSWESWAGSRFCENIGTGRLCSFLSVFRFTHLVPFLIIINNNSFSIKSCKLWCQARGIFICLFVWQNARFYTYLIRVESSRNICIPNSHFILLLIRSISLSVFCVTSETKMLISHTRSLDLYTLFIYSIPFT